MNKWTYHEKIFCIRLKYNSSYNTEFSYGDYRKYVKQGKERSDFDLETEIKNQKGEPMRFSELEMPNVTENRT